MQPEAASDTDLPVLTPRQAIELDPVVLAVMHSTVQLWKIAEAYNKRFVVEFDSIVAAAAGRLTKRAVADRLIAQAYRMAAYYSSALGRGAIQASTPASSPETRTDSD